MEKKNMLSVNNVTKKYGNFTALQNINMEFDHGVYGLLAPNGAGKTTLMNMLATLSFPTKGEILWNGTDIRQLDEEYRNILGFLPQQFGYYKNYSPRQFLHYMAALKGIRKRAADQKIEMLLKEVSLAGDRIVILSTHIVSDIETIADKIILLKDHKLLCCEAPAKICSILRDKVFEVPVGVPIHVPHEVLYERQTDMGTVLRIYSEAYPEGAVKVSPNLEDVFLVVYRDERKSTWN